ncbi:MAG: DUF2069 domain-containing protein [Rhodocyclaceae bacterium]|jgi:uncharacterized membrane protein|nr:hypothetical protein [Rhodocyclaceae bacterium]MBZ0142805.1 DUF2069 domain-containing protein [Rhodocyclaceae bacterium]MCC6878778.1 DUF2069 domain-containing protein [Rhodocyclaceae bacterium]MCL4679975.1 DUF2069 domain-containing protein [Rhodocyclaceae bacterium]
MHAARLWNRLAIASLLALIFLCLAWELWWAPLRPGGSWLALKALPLLAPLFGLLRSRRYTHQWVTLLALAYFTEGIVRAVSESGRSAALAGVETVLALVLFASAVLYVRASAKVSPCDTAG